MPDLRRYEWTIEVSAAFLGATVAGLLLMAPLDFAWTSSGPSLQVDLLVMNVPRAAAAGAVLAVVAAALAVSLGVRAAWVAALGSATILLVDHLRDPAAAAALTTVNYVDSLFGGILLGALAVAALRRPATGYAFLTGILSAVLIGDLTALPAGTASSLAEWAATDTPPVWLIALAVLALAAGTLLNRLESPLGKPDYGDLPLGPIVAALLLLTSHVVAAEWIARQADSFADNVLAVAVTMIVTGVVVLLLPARDGVLVLLAVAAANVGSAITAVPRPDWSMPIPLLGVAAGLWAGRRWPRPWAGLLAAAALAVFAALTAGRTATPAAAIPILGITALALIVGYCFGAVTPSAAPSTVLAVVVLVVPCLVLALRGNSFGRVAYSPRWFRDPADIAAPAAGWTALAIVGCCGIGMSAVYALRPESRVVATAAPSPLSQRDRR
ncbi:MULTISPECIES: hypothetical protein [unclassified Nocardia]|uniref:hypothetical protein n=1 Tax=unclassified Nocardia TaxID=2637762 RepID=UPI00278C32F5|nr:MULTISPECIES: hypothetical protein [unclassified Nocardia]